MARGRVKTSLTINGDKLEKHIKEIEGDKNASDVMLTFFFLPSEPSDYQKYNEMSSAFMKDINFKTNIQDLEVEMNKNGFDLVKHDYPSLPKLELSYKSGILKVTNFGKNFIDICLS